MMDMFSNLWNRGGSSAPTDMSQIRVQEQPMDLSGTVGAANSQLDYSKAAQNVADQNAMWSSLGNAALLAGSTALANANSGAPKGGSMGGADKFSGARMQDATNAEKLSGARLSDMQQFAQAGGLLNAAG